VIAFGVGRGPAGAASRSVLPLLDFPSHRRWADYLARSRERATASDPMLSMRGSLLRIPGNRVLLAPPAAGGTYRGRRSVQDPWLAALAQKEEFANRAPVRLGPAGITGKPQRILVAGCDRIPEIRSCGCRKLLRRCPLPGRRLQGLAEAGRF